MLKRKPRRHMVLTVHGKREKREAELHQFRLWNSPSFQKLERHERWRLLQQMVRGGPHE